MQIRPLVMILAAALIGPGCANKETKPEAAAPVAAQEVAKTSVESAPAASKPVCPPEPTAKVKTTKSGKAAKSKTEKKKETPPPDCEPASAKSTPSNSKSAAAAPAPVKEEPAKEAAPAPAPAAKAGDAQKPRVVKSRDGTFEGEIYGNIPAGSKWAKLQIGMEQPEVERILGGSSNDVRHMPTAKAFIPFYYGTDRYRYEVVYRGQGSVSYTGGSWGGGRGVLMMINYDPNI